MKLTKKQLTVFQRQIAAIEYFTTAELSSPGVSAQDREKIAAVRDSVIRLAALRGTKEARENRAKSSLFDEAESTFWSILLTDLSIPRQYLANLFAIFFNPYIFTLLLQAALQGTRTRGLSENGGWPADVDNFLEEVMPLINNIFPDWSIRVALGRS
jgi:hypothetical protein